MTNMRYRLKSNRLPSVPTADRKTIISKYNVSLIRFNCFLVQGPSQSPLCHATREALSDYRKKVYNGSTYGVTWGVVPCKDRCAPASPQAKKQPEIKPDCSSPTGSILSRSKYGSRIMKRVRFVDQDRAGENNSCYGITIEDGHLCGLAPSWPPSAYLLDKTFQIKEDLERFPVKFSNNSDQVNKVCDIRRNEDAKVKDVNQSDVYFGYEGKCFSEMCRNTFRENVCDDEITHGCTHPTCRPCKRWATFQEWKKRMKDILD
jgi:hypothetical protein